MIDNRRPSNSWVPIWIEEGLIQKLDRDIVTNMDNIDERWVDVDFDPGREYTVPWAWGTTGVTVNTSVYDGNPHTADIFLDPPDELKGKVNVVPEMNDIMHVAVRAASLAPAMPPPITMTSVVAGTALDDIGGIPTVTTGPGILSAARHPESGVGGLRFDPVCPRIPVTGIMTSRFRFVALRPGGTREPRQYPFDHGGDAADRTWWYRQAGLPR